MIEPLDRSRHDSALFQFTPKQLRRFRSLVDEAIQSLSGS